MASPSYSFYCPTCGILSLEEGECSCGDGPFLDLRTQFARDLLEGTDERLRRKRNRLHRYLAVAPAFASTVLVAWFFPSMYMDTLTGDANGEILLGVAVGFGLFYMAILKALWPHRSHLGLLKKIPLNQETRE